MQELFRSIPAIVNEFEPNDQVRGALVFAAWRRAAGEMLSERSLPVEYIEKTLVVAVTDETWRRQLVDLSGRMIFKLNAELGEGIVAFIEFRIDKKAISRKRGKLKTLTGGEPAAFEAILPDLMKSAAAIKPENLRSQFLLTANAYLSRNRI